MNTGFIGYGSMGSMLINGFLSARALAPEQVFVATRTRERLAGLPERWPGIHVLDSNGEAAKESRVIFICVKPLEVKGVLTEIAPFCGPETHIVSIAGGVSLKNIESLFAGKVTKVIPSLTSEVGEGISLVCHNEKVDPDSERFVEGLLGSIGSVKKLAEKDLEIAAELTSCAPGLIAAIFEEFARAGMKYGAFAREEVEAMVLRTLFGTARLMLEKRMSFAETVGRVATKGGITEEGVKVLRKGLPPVFDELFTRSMDKRAAVREKINKQFSG